VAQVNSKRIASKQIRSLASGKLVLLLWIVASGAFAASSNNFVGPKLGPPGFQAHPSTLPVDLNLKLDTFDLTTNFVTGTIEAGLQLPDKIAVVVKALSDPAPNEVDFAANRPKGTNGAEINRFNDLWMKQQNARLAEEQVDWKKANWISFTNSVLIDLGPGEGRRIIWLMGIWTNATGYRRTGTATHVRVDRTPPEIVITNPRERITSQPMIELQGYSPEDLRSIRYELINTSNHLSGEGLVNDRHYDMRISETTTNQFTCYDIALAPGTNELILRCQDQAGNISTNHYIFVFDLTNDKTPPTIALDWPHDGQKLTGGDFTARGRLDDFTARITGVISTPTGTNAFTGLVERNGYFWLEEIPLQSGSNYLTVVATDAAGNSSQTNIVIYQKPGTLTIDPVPPEQLWWKSINASGKVSPADQTVWVNGVKAQVRADGTWTATNVPVKSPNGGTAVFELTTEP
jgi:hypothetical protein